jgi:hypothetical protein
LSRLFDLAFEARIGARSVADLTFEGEEPIAKTGST